MATKERTKKKETIEEHHTPHAETGKPKKIYFLPAVILFIAGLLFYFKGLFIAATVNGQPISRLAVIHDLEKQAGQRALDSMITKALIQQEANKRGVTVTDKEVKDEAEKVKKNIEAQGQSLESVLQTQGMSQEQFMSEVKLQKLLEKMMGEVTVTNKEIDAFLETNKQMVTEETDTEALKKQLKESLKQEKMSKKVQEFIQNLKKSAKINYFTSY